MPVRLSGSTSGYTELAAPAAAGNNTLVLPTTNGSNGQFLQGNGSGTLSWSGSLTLGTAQNSTSGTAIDFTGIPSWVKRVTVLFNGVSTNGTSHLQVQVGAGSVSSSGYSSYSTYAGGSNNAGGISLTSGFAIYSGNALNVFNGKIALHLISANIWVSDHTFSIFQSPNIFSCFGGGNVTLSGTLDRVRITTVNGTDTFDAGSINIMYEG